MTSLLPLDQWVWPSRIEDLANRAPDPDRLASLPSPTPLDWVECGLPAQAARFGDLAGSFLSYDAARERGSSVLRGCDEGRSAWEWDGGVGGPVCVDPHDESRQAQAELAFLVALRRGANPWDWRSSDGSPRPIRLLLGWLDRGLLVAARAMLAHPARWSLGMLENHRVYPERGIFRCNQPMPLASGLARLDRFRALSLLREAGFPLNTPGPASPLAQSCSPAMVEYLLQHARIEPAQVVEALLAWHAPSSPPDSPLWSKGNVLSDMLEKVEAWWQSRGLGDARQWLAQLACMRAIAALPVHDTSPIPAAQVEEWYRQVGSSRGVVWLTWGSFDRKDSISSDPIGPGHSGLPPGYTGKEEGFGPRPAAMVGQWIQDRTWPSLAWGPVRGEVHPDTPWDEHGKRVNRLEAWKSLEQGLGKWGKIKAWQEAWSCFWAWAPPLPEWSMEEASTAARLWGMEDGVLPPPRRDLAAYGPDALSALDPAIRQVVGEAFALSVVGRCASSEPGSPLDDGGQGFSLLSQLLSQAASESKVRIGWLEAWLQTPGWVPPELTDFREQVLRLWSPPSMGHDALVRLWRERRLAEVLTPQAHSSSRPRL